MQEVFEKILYDKVLEKAWQPLGMFDEHSPLVIKVSDVKEIVNQTAAEYNNGWIPVEERLPEESNYYCVTTENMETGDRIEQRIWFAHKDDYDIEESEWREICGYEKVIAWRHSEPYQKGE